MTLTKREELLLDYITAVIEDEGAGVIRGLESCQVILCGYFCEDLFSAIGKGRKMMSQKRESKNYMNPGVVSGVNPLNPSGTNSTHSTECCGVAICQDESDCPYCGRHVIGYQAESHSERARIRWRYATRHWVR